MQHVMGCRFPLLNGEVNDFVRSGAITCGKNMRYLGPHGCVGMDPAHLVSQSCLVKVQSCHMGLPSETVQDCLCEYCLGFAMLLKGDEFSAPLDPSIHEPGMGEKLHSFFLEGCLQGLCHVFVKCFEHVGASLDQRGSYTKP